MRDTLADTDTDYTKIYDFDNAVLEDEDVGGLDVAVDKISLMSVI